jgi:hypothetical protein
MKFYWYIHAKYNSILDWVVWKFQNPYKIQMPSGNCPVQSEGLLPTGEWYYFRARGSRWSLQIAKTEEDWWSDERGEKLLFNHQVPDYCQWPEAGYLSKRKCIKLATSAIEKFYETTKI